MKKVLLGVLLAVSAFGNLYADTVAAVMVISTQSVRGTKTFTDTTQFGGGPCISSFTSTGYLNVPACANITIGGVPVLTSTQTSNFAVLPATQTFSGVNTFNSATTFISSITVLSSATVDYLQIATPGSLNTSLGPIKIYGGPSSVFGDGLTFKSGLVNQANFDFGSGSYIYFSNTGGSGIRNIINGDGYVFGNDPATNDGAGYGMKVYTIAGVFDRLTLKTAGNDVLNIQGNNVGIGTASPAARLHIGTGSSTFPTTDVNLLVRESGSGSNFISIDNAMATTGDSGLFFATQVSNLDSAIYLDQSDGAKMKFSMGDPGTKAGRDSGAKIIIQQNGNVGLSTSAPQALLDVNGSALFRGINTFNSATTFVSSITVLSSVTASAFFGNGANLTNISVTTATATGDFALLHTTQTFNAQNTFQQHTNLSGGLTSSSGTFSGVVQAGTSYNISSQKVLSINSGNGSLFLGAGAGDSNTTGSQNTFLGSSAGTQNNVGSDNSFIGSGSGATNSSGTANTFTGRTSGTFNTTGSNNSFYGFESAALNTTASSNTAIGYKAGYNNQTGGSNVFLGFQAGYNETGSNTLYIGNSSTNTIIYGDFSTGNVGISSTTPTEKLSVTGNGAFTGSVRASTFNAVGSAYQMNGTTFLDSSRNLSVASATFSGNVTASGTSGVLTSSLSGSNLFVSASNVGGQLQLDAGSVGNIKMSINNGAALSIDSSKRVGIGTATPASKLTVFNGDIQISTDTGSRGVIFQDGTTQTTAFPGSGGFAQLAATQTFSGQNTFTSHTNLSGGLTSSSGTFSGAVQASTFNAVGSAYQMNGTTFLDSDKKLTVSTSTFTGDISLTGTGPGNISTIFGPSASDLRIRGRNNLRLDTESATDPIIFEQDEIEIARFSASANLGISSSVPTEKLSVTGNGAFTGSVRASTFNAVGSAYQMNGTTFLDSSRNLSVASATFTDNILDSITGNPAGASGLTVNNPTNSNTGQGIAKVSNGSNSITMYQQGTSYITSSQYIQNSSLLEGTNGLGISASGAHALKFYTNANEIASFDSSGNLGIGTTSSPLPLTVNGSSQFGSGATKSTFTVTGALNLANSAALTVSGATGYVSGASSITTTGGLFGQTATVGGLSIAGATITSTTDGIFLVTQPGQNLLIPNGNVGISSSVPTEKLSVTGNGLFTGSVSASTFNAVGSAYQMNGTTFLGSNLNLSVASGTFTGDVTGKSYLIAGTSVILATRQHSASNAGQSLPGFRFENNTDSGLALDNATNTEVFIDVDATKIMGGTATQANIYQDTVITSGKSMTFSGAGGYVSGASSITTTGGLFGQTATIGNLSIQGSTLAANGSLTITTDSISGAVPNFFLSGSGSIGVGTGSPTSKLTVLDGDIQISTTTGSRGIIFQDGTTQVSAAATAANTAILTATQTFSGVNTFTSPSVFAGSVTISTGMTIGDNQSGIRVMIGSTTSPGIYSQNRGLTAGENIFQFSGNPNNRTRADFVSYGTNPFEFTVLSYGNGGAIQANEIAITASSGTPSAPVGIGTGTANVSLGAFAFRTTTPDGGRQRMASILGVAEPNQTLTSYPAQLQFRTRPVNNTGNTDTVKMILTSTGTLAIGNSLTGSMTPAAMLEIVNDSASQQYAFVISSNTAGGTQLFKVDAGGNTELGSDGTVSTFTSLGQLQYVSGGTLTISGTGINISSTNALLPIATFSDTGGTATNITTQFIDRSAASGDTRWQFLNSGQRMVFYRNNNAGNNLILTKSRGTLEAPLAVLPSDNAGGVLFRVSSGPLSAFAIPNTNIASILGTVESSTSSTSLPGFLQFNTVSSGTIGTVTEKMRLTSEGNLGINNSNPAQKLHLSSGTILVDGNTATSIITSGAISIGTATGNADFQIRTGAGNNSISMFLGGTPTGNSSGLLRFANSNTKKNFQMDFNEGVSGALQFKRSTAVGGETFTTADLLIDDVGNVGISSTTPTEKLSVTGNGAFTGSVRASIFNAVGSAYQMNGTTFLGSNLNLSVASATFSGTISGNGSGITSISTAALPTNVAILTATQTFSGFNTFNSGTGSPALTVNGQPGNLGFRNNGNAEFSSGTVTLDGSGATLTVGGTTNLNGTANVRNASAILNIESTQNNGIGSLNFLDNVPQITATLSYNDTLGDLVLNRAGISTFTILNSGNFIFSGGNVGIGTTAPGATLDVNGNASFGSGATKSTFSTTGSLSLASGATLTVPFLATLSSTTHSSLATFTNNNSTQAVFSGFSAFGGALAANGLIRVGQNARIDYNNGGNGDLYIENTTAGTGAIIGLKRAGSTVFTMDGNGLTSIYGIVTSSSVIPAFACNAGTPTPENSNTANAGTFTAGTAAANCTLTFASAWFKNPNCQCQNQTSPLVNGCKISARSTTAVTFASAGAAFGGDSITYFCWTAPAAAP